VPFVIVLHLSKFLKRTMPHNPQIPKELADLLAKTKPVSELDLHRLEKTGKEIDRDYLERAALQKALFVNSILAAMQSENLTKSEVARRMKCSRQNLNRLLNEDSAVNFTIETMSNLASATARRIEILVVGENEFAHIVKCELQPELFLSETAPTQTRDFSSSSNVVELDFSAGKAPESEGKEELVA
jgi:transcriptional regulator with XRE-family HTH domain